MEVTNIELADNKPTHVTARFTTEEAAYLVKLLGPMSYASAEETMRGAGKLEIYGYLTGCFFNLFWDSGIDGYLRGDDE